MPPATVIYDITRDGVGVAPIGVLLMWLGGAVVVVVAALRPRGPRRIPVPGAALWLALWLTIGGFGIGNVFYQHFRCRAWAASGSFDVVQGVVTDYQPEASSPRKSERLTVGGHTWTYGTANLGSGGYRGVPAAGD